MFEEVQEQFHQFFAPPPPQHQQTRAASPNNSLPLSFSLLHGSLHPPPPPPSSSPFPIFDTYSPHPHPLQPPIHHHHHHHPHPHHLHQQMLQYPPVAAAIHSKSVKQEGQVENSNTSGFLSRSLVVERERSSVTMELDLGQPSWSHDEVLALFRVRSALEDWFPDFTWEHVSRKMEEIGFRRSPQKCKEKFEEERRYLHHTTTSSINADDISCPTKNNYRLFSELEELCQNDIVLDKQQNHQAGEPQLQEQEQEDDDHDGGGQGQDRIGQEALVDENDGSEATDHHHHHHMVTTIDDQIDEVEKEKGVEKRRGKGHDHRKKKFEIFKGFCEDIVSKMMAHQEELHNKILEDLIKRDEEKIAREEAWRKQEIERINKEMEARAKDQAMAGDRQAKIIEFLKKFTMNNSNIDEANNATILQNPSSSATHSSLNYNNYHIPSSSNDESLSQSQTSNSLTTHIDPTAPTSNSAEENKMQPISRKPKRSIKRPACSTTSDPIYDDSGKRWPREEVLALINIRCNLDSSNNNAAGSENTEHSDRNKNPPLWERISKSMTELGYKRSAKRCKEKWENINKYFRKTKDSKKKRTVDSRTCPYFHQLSHLYSHGRISGGNHGGGDDASVNLSDQGEPNGAHVTTTSA